MSQPTPKDVATKALSALYWWTCVAFWVADFAAILLNRPNARQGPGPVLEFWTRIVGFTWHPTNDPVLNFFVDLVLCIIGLAILPGVFIVAFYLVVTVLVVGVLALIAVGLLALAKLSVTGAIVAAVIAALLVWLLLRSLPKLGDALRPVGSALFGVFGMIATATPVSYASSASGDGGPKFESGAQSRAAKDSWPWRGKDVVLAPKNIHEKGFLLDRKVGHIEEPPLLGNDERIYKENLLTKTEVGRIKEATLLKPTTIVDQKGREMGKIKKEFLGKEIIVTKEGKKIGEYKRGDRK